MVLLNKINIYFCDMLNIELKFKAWNKVTKKIYRSGALSFSTERHSFLLHTDKTVTESKDSDMEIMQYTGQKDVNNKEIYQRDIIELDEFKFIIVWDNNKGGWAYTDVERRIRMASFGRSEANRCTVVGNQFENPEMLNP